MEHKIGWLPAKSATKESPSPAIHSSPGEATVQRGLLQKTYKEGKIIAVFETASASPVRRTVMAGFIITLPDFLYADLTLSVTEYTRKEHNRRSQLAALTRLT